MMARVFVDRRVWIKSFWPLFQKVVGMGETHNGPIFSAPVSAALVSVALIGFSLSFVGGQTSAVYWQF